VGTLSLEDRVASPWPLDLTLGDTPFDKSALARRKQAQIFSREVEVASPEI
jgi:hypothetical protein